MKVKFFDGFGAEITDVDISAGLSSTTFADVKQVFSDHGLIYFRDQTIDEQQHIEFSEQWGPININRFFTAHDNYPQIALVTKEPEQKINLGGTWHTDHSYDVEPAMGSIIVARELPETGGDTWFANMYKVFESLSPSLQNTLLGLNAVHSARHAFGSKKGHHSNKDARVGNAEMVDAMEDVIHPVVITHPLSGKKSLYVNPGFTRRFEGWSREDSLPILKHLFEVAISDQFITKFKWRPGSIAFWDNRATWHCAQNDYPGQRREMHRITIGGCALTKAELT